MTQLAPVLGTAASCAFAGCGFHTQAVQARSAADRGIMEMYALRRLVEHYETVHASSPSPPSSPSSPSPPGPRTPP